jgi:serine phosphatase RsbU (regulator of sigma subunit)
VVGDVCGKGVPAAKSTALARYTLRAEAHRQTRPSLILAALNQALLDWLTDDPRFLTAIYATVRPTRAGASVQISSAGHPLALMRRADGRVQTFGRPGTLLGLLPDPELHDSRGPLRAGDSLILFTDGVTEARSHLDRDLYGEDRLRGLIAGLGEASAALIADAIQRTALAFSGGTPTDDTVALVLKIPSRERTGSTNSHPNPAIPAWTASATSAAPSRPYC